MFAVSSRSTVLLGITTPCVGLLLGLSVVAAVAQSQPGTSRVSRPDQYAWTREPWDSKDPFARIRLDVDTALARQTKPGQLVSQHQVALKKRPESPQALFQLAYSSYQQSLQTRKVDTRRVSELNRKFAQLPSPHSYQYARMRFITEAIAFPTSKLKSVGLRLLHRNPKDVDVNFHIINMLDLSKPQEKATAFVCARRLVQINPQRPSSHSSLGWVYCRSWMLTKSPQDADKAIAAYTKYLQLAPKNDPFRPRAQQIIAMIRKRQGS